MSGILDLIQNYQVRHFEAGEVILEQGVSGGIMLVLLEGSVEVLRDGIAVASTSEPGVVFGEMSTLLDQPHTATVRAKSRSSFAVIDNPRDFLRCYAQASYYVAELLARRLNALTRYLADVKRQYEGHDHIAMVDEVLETLMHRQPTKTAR